MGICGGDPTGVQGHCSGQGVKGRSPSEAITFSVKRYFLTVQIDNIGKICTKYRIVTGIPL